MTLFENLLLLVVSVGLAMNLSILGRLSRIVELLEQRRD